MAIRYFCTIYGIKYSSTECRIDRLHVTAHYVTARYLRHGTLRHGTLRHGTERYLHHGTLRHGTLRHVDLHKLYIRFSRPKIAHITKIVEMYLYLKLRHNIHFLYLLQKIPDAYLQKYVKKRNVGE